MNCLLRNQRNEHYNFKKISPADSARISHNILCETRALALSVQKLSQS